MAVAVGLGAAWVPAGQAAPLFEPDDSWAVLDTAHFRIYYTRPLARKARQVAAIAEDSYAHVVPYMQVKPRGITEVVVADGYDELNSMAHSSPHRAVWLWMTPPNPDEGMWIGRYDSWLRMLFVHEFAHILQFEHTQPYVNQVNTAMGGLLFGLFPQLPIDVTLNLPDLLTNPPAFVMEGQAVHTESTYTPGGRGVEGDFDMIRRMALLSGKEPQFDQIQGRFLLDWPMGGYEYTWGTAWVQALVKHHGADAAQRVFKAFGAFPWLGYSQAMQRSLGVSPQQVWEEMLQDLRVRAEGDLAAWRARQQQGAPLPEVVEHTQTGRHHRHPTFDRQGRLLYLEALRNQGPRLWRLPAGGAGAPENLMGKSTRSAIALSPDGTRAYFENSTSDTVKGLNEFRDLFVYDFAAKKARRLTHGARTFAPALSPDGKTLVAMLAGEGQSGLGFFDTEGRFLRAWRYDHDDFQFGNPVWSPDGQKLAVAVWHQGSRDLWLVDPQSGRFEPLWKDAAMDVHPAWSPDGRFLVFGSDRSGTHNLYAFELASRRMTQLTDALGGAFDPAISPDGKRLAYARYTARGYDLVSQAFDPLAGRPVASPPKAALPWPEATQPTLAWPPSRPSYSNWPEPIARLFPHQEEARTPDLTQPPAGPQAGLVPPEVRPELHRPGQAMAHLGYTPVMAPRPYSPFPSILPSVWFPIMSSDERGNNLTVYTFWQDLLRQHALTVVGGYGLFSQRLNYGFRYENTQRDLQWSVSAFEYPQAGRVALSGATPEDVKFASLWQWNKNLTVGFDYPGLRFPLFDPPPINGTNWSWGYRYEQLKDYALQADDGGSLVGLDTHPQQPTANDEGQAHSLYLQWARAEAVRLPYDMAPSQGSISSAGAEMGGFAPRNPQLLADNAPLMPIVANTMPFAKLWADHRTYHVLPWGQRHLLATRSTAGLVYARNGEFFFSLWQRPFGYQPLATVNRWDLTTASDYSTRHVMVRGYPFLLGNRVLSTSAEYRLPLAEVMRGWGEAPLFLNRVYGVGFVDAGAFWGFDPRQVTDLPTLNDLKLGTGAELRFQTSMFGALPIDVRAGFARGLTSGGDWQFNWGLGTTY